MNAAKARLEQAEQQLAALQDDSVTDEQSAETAEQLTERLEDLQSQQRKLIEEQGRNLHRLDEDQRRRQEQVQLLQDIQYCEAEYEDIGYLTSLIGSKKGDKFRKFAQSLNAGASGLSGEYSAAEAAWPVSVTAETGGSRSTGVTGGGYLAGRCVAGYQDFIRWRKFSG